MPKVRYFLDTEFIERPHTIDLLSIALVCEDGRSIYRVSSDADRDAASDWVKEHVLPRLHAAPFVPEDVLAPREKIASDLLAFIKAKDGEPEFWTWYGDYDWVVFCWLFGCMVDLPQGFPMFALDLRQTVWQFNVPRGALAPKPSVEHNAWHDAMWLRDSWIAAQAWVPEEYRSR